MGSCEIERLEIETLLFQTGYVTIKAQFKRGVRNRYRLSIATSLRWVG